MKAAVYYEVGGSRRVSVRGRLRIRSPGPPNCSSRSRRSVSRVATRSTGFKVRSSTRPHIVGYQCAGTVLEAGPQVERVCGRGPGRDGRARRLPRGPSGDGALVCVEGPRRPEHRPGGLRADSVRHGPRLPVRVRAAGCRRDGPRPCWRRRGWDCGDPDGQAGRGRVLSTASSDEKLERLKELGLDEGINYATTDFVAEARRLTDGRGVDVVVDSVGGVTLQGSINALAYRGRCVSVGDAGRTAAESLDISTMRPNNQTLSGYFLGAELPAVPSGLPDDRGAAR